MTTARIDTYQDLLDLLDEKPRWLMDLRVRLLTAELIALPEQFARFAEESSRRQAATESDVRELKEGQARTEADVQELKEGQARTEADVRDLKEGQARTEADVRELKEGQARTEADVRELKEGQARLEERQTRTEADVQELKKGQARLEADVQELKEGQARTDENFARMEARQNRMDGTINNLRGDKYERRITRFIALTARRDLNMQDVRILLGEFTLDNNELANLLAEAEDGRNVVTREQGRDLERADIIIAGVDRDDGRTVYAVIEVALTLDRDDIARAERRAATLAAATGGTVLPVVVGDAIGVIDQRRADDAGVTVLIIYE